MVGQLRAERQRTHVREAPADDAEVERRDREARERSAASRADAGAVEYDRPGEREGEVHRHGGGDELRAARLARQQDRARGEHRRERIAAGRERVHGRGDPAQRGGPGGCSERAPGWPKDRLARWRSSPAGEESAEERVTPLELFFDLIFVFAITQVTGFVVDDPTWARLARGLLVLGVLWWSWAAYAWLTNTINPEEGVVRIAMFGAMAAMLIASLAVPDVFGDDAFFFACAYAVVRVAHLVLYAVAGRGDRDLLGAQLRAWHPARP